MAVLALHAAFGVALLTLGAAGAGAWIGRALPASFHRLDRVSCTLLGGFGLLSLVLFLIGQVAFTRGVIWVVLCAAAAAGIAPALRFCRASGEASSCFAGARLPAAIVFAVLALAAVAGLAEITGDWGNDTVAYHLLGPKVWLRNGVIRPVADNSHTSFPATAETMYAALLVVGGPRAPGFSSVLMWPMLLLVAAALAMRCGLDRTGAWWVAAILSAMPAVYDGSMVCFVDGLYAAFVLAAVRVGFDAERPRDWAICGIFCGLAMGTKYPGILALPVILLCAMAMRVGLRGGWRDEARWRRAAKGALLAALLGCAVAAPYYLRNEILLGCPIYPPPPGFSRVCTPKYFSPDVLAAFHDYILQRGAGLGRGLGAFLLLPFNLTYHTANFHGAGGIGLCPLALAPLGLIAARRDRFVRLLALAGFLLLAIWFVSQQESRFLIHAYVIAAILAVIGWRSVLANGNRASRAIAAGVVGISLGYGFFMLAAGWSGSVHSVLSPNFAAAQRAKDDPYRASFDYVNRSPDVTRLLILDRSVPPYYSDKDYIKPVGQWGERTLPGAPDSQQALREAAKLGVSHVLDVQSELGTFQVPPGDAGLTLVFEADGQRVYRVN